MRGKKKKNMNSAKFLIFMKNLKITKKLFKNLTYLISLF